MKTMTSFHNHNRLSTKHSPFFPNSKFILISMASILFFSLVSLSLFFALSSSSSHHHNHNHRHAPPKPSAGAKVSPSSACKATRFPDACEASLKVPASASAPEVILAAISVSSENLQTAQKMVKSILESSSGNINRTTAANNCMEVLSASEYRLRTSCSAVTRGGLKNARAWMGAALQYQYDCWSALKYANDTSQVNQTMSFLDSLTKLSSNALSMLASYDAFGNDTASWRPPRTERDGFWEGSGGGVGAGLGSRGGFPAKVAADVTVCKGGGCDFETVQKGVEAASSSSGKRFVIHIKEGVYEETVRVGIEKTNLVFLGDGMGKTVITGSLHVGPPGISTYNTATVGVVGDGFMANGLTIQNTAGPDAHQAVAFRSDSDLSVIENCEFIGNQDTLYARSLRQFYKSCRIQGNVDFIFGNSASVFQDCTVLIAPRQVRPEKGEKNAVTAQGRTDPAQPTGFVFHSCLVNGTEDYVKLYNANPKVHLSFLGRPWKEFSRTVFLRCRLEPLVTARGWLEWSGEFALSTLFYGEFENSGVGSNVSMRVPWSSEIPKEHVLSYSVQSFIQGEDWIPNNDV